MTKQKEISNTTARYRVREQIQRLILSGQCRPGSRLVQQQLAKRFGVAQSVIRESLLELQHCGLVETIDNLGVFVSNLDHDKLIQAYQVREVLEGLAARECCEHVTRADIRRLTELAGVVYALGREGKDRDKGIRDRDFHSEIIRCSGNQILVRLAESYRILGMLVRAERENNEILEEHLALVRAIEEDRPDDAERLAREHVRAARKAIQERIAKEGFELHWVEEEAK
jgi:DNA-binding GntR family transcriptional regulator